MGGGLENLSFVVVPTRLLDVERDVVRWRKPCLVAGARLTALASNRGADGGAVEGQSLQ